MGPPLGIDQMTHRTMSGHSTIDHNYDILLIKTISFYNFVFLFNDIRNTFSLTVIHIRVRNIFTIEKNTPVCH